MLWLVLGMLGAGLMSGGLSPLSAGIPAHLGEQNELVHFAEEHFDKSLPDQWKSRFQAKLRRGDWALYGARFPGFDEVAIGVCHNRVVHMYASLRQNNAYQKLQDMIQKEFSSELLDHLLLLENSKSSSYFLLKSKSGSRRCAR